MLGFNLGVPGKMLPAKKLVGGKALGEKIEKLLEQLESPFVITSDYGTASLAAFYAPSHPEVAVANTGGRRRNQYDLWTDWEAFQGRSALLVVKNEKDLKEMNTSFESFEVLPEDTLRFIYGGEEVRTFFFALGENYSGR